MADIDISKITGKLRELAERADKAENGGNGDGKLNFNPASIFTQGESKTFMEYAKEAGMESEASYLLDGHDFQGNNETWIPGDTITIENQQNKVSADKPEESAQKMYIVSDDKKSQKSARKDVLASIAKATATVRAANTDAKSIDWGKVAEKLISDVEKGEIIDTYTRGLVNVVKEVAIAMNGAKYDSKDDIKGIKKEVKDKLKEKDDEFSDFRKDVLKEFVKMAEVHQISKEQAKLNDRYNYLRKTQGMSRKEAYDTIKKDKNFKGSYYSNSYENDTYHKGLVSKMKDGIILDDARNEVWSAIHDQKTGKDGKITRKGVKKAAKDSISNKSDKYTAKVWRGERSFAQKNNGERSLVKDYQRSVAAANGAEYVKSITHSGKDLMEVIDSSKLKKLAQRGAITVQKTDSVKPVSLENSQFDISKLVDIVRATISKADGRGDYQTKKLAEHGEIDNLTRRIYEQYDVKLSRSEAKNLIDYCKQYRDKRDLNFYLGSVYRNTLGGLVGLVGSGVTALAMTTKTGDPITNFAAANEALLNREFPITVNANNDFNLSLRVNIDTYVNGELTNGVLDIDDWALTKQLAAQGFNVAKDEVVVNAGENYIELIISKNGEKTSESIHKLAEILGENFDIEDDLGLEAEKGKEENNKKDSFLKGIVASLIVNAIMACFKEMKGEEDLLNTDVKAETLEGFYRTLETNKVLQKNPRLKDAITVIAETFAKKDKDGNDVMVNAESGEVEHALDNEKLSKFLKEMAGTNSFLNRRELLFEQFNQSKEMTLVPKPEALKKPEEKVEEKEVKYSTPTVTPSVTEPIPVAKPEVVKKPEDPKIPLYKKIELAEQTIDGNKYHWNDIINVYPGLEDKYGQDKAKRMLKVAQAMDGKYDAETLEKIADISMNKSKAKELETMEIEGFDYAKFKDFLAGTGEVKLPAELAGIKLDMSKLEQKTKGAPGTYKTDAKSNARQYNESYSDGYGNKYNSEDDAVKKWGKDKIQFKYPRTPKK